MIWNKMDNLWGNRILCKIKCIPSRLSNNLKVKAPFSYKVRKKVRNHLKLSDL